MTTLAWIELSLVAIILMGWVAWRLSGIFVPKFPPVPVPNNPRVETYEVSVESLLQHQEWAEVKGFPSLAAAINSLSLKQLKEAGL